MENDSYCPRCVHKHSTYGGKLLCTVGMVAVPVESQRHYNGSCGPDAVLFDPPGMEDMGLEYS